jgi:hypothetical protein
MAAKCDRPDARGQSLRFTSVLHVLWIALLGSDRIDLLGGNGPALLLPFHVLTILVLAVEWKRRMDTRTLPRVDARTATFAALLLGLLALVALSILRSADVVVSTGRAILFAATAISVPLVIWAMADRDDLMELLGRGGAWGLGIALIYSALQVLAFLGRVPEDVRVGPASIHLATAIYETIPRLAGASADMNRGGLMALFHTVLVVIGLPPGRARRLWIGVGIFLIVGSLSRSVALASVMVLALQTPALLRTQRLRGIAVGASMALSVAAGISALLLDPRIREGSARFFAPLEKRLQITEGSASAHTYLLERGVEVATADVPNTLIGIGFGASFKVLSDYFAGFKYGNFHSTWVTLWAEAGIFAMLVAFALLLLPIRTAGPLTGLLLGLVFYNAFYNGHLEPMLWVTIALVWLAPHRLMHRTEEAARVPA